MLQQRIHTVLTLSYIIEINEALYKQLLGCPREIQSAHYQTVNSNTPTLVKLQLVALTLQPLYELNKQDIVLLYGELLMCW